ncbi:MAG: hypothetical protein R6X10_14735 [Desulfobacterales bacterium]
MAEKEKKCEDCEYWRKDQSTAAGECRRNAPTSGGDRSRYRWPLTEPQDWCGEYGELKQTGDPSVTTVF